MLGVWDLKFRVWGQLPVVLDFNHGHERLVTPVLGFGFRVQGSELRIWGSGFRVQWSTFRMQGSKFRFQGFGFRVQGLASGFRV